MAEHAQMRVLLADIAACIEAPDWFRGAGLDRVRRTIESLQRFDQEVHRPKGTALVAALRQCGAPMQRFLDELESEGDACTRQLDGALDLLSRLSNADSNAAQACAEALRTHGARMAQHLEREDTELRTRALRELGPEAWSRIVSSISATVRRR